VEVEDDHKFQGFGVSGMAYTLNRLTSAFVVLPPGYRVSPVRQPTIVVPAQGDVYLELPKTQHHSR